MLNARYIDNYLLMSVTFHAKSSSTGWKAIPPVRSGYGEDTLLDRCRSDGRCRSARTAVHTLAAVIATEEHVDDMTFIYSL